MKSISYIICKYREICYNRYPLSIKLKLQYSLFLYDHLHQRQQALQELFKLDELNPSFDEEFIIYSMKFFKYIYIYYVI